MDKRKLNKGIHSGRKKAWGSKQLYPGMDIDRGIKPLRTKAINKYNQIIKLSGYLAEGDIVEFDNEWNKLHPNDPIKKPNRFMRLIGRV